MSAKAVRKVLFLGFVVVGSVSLCVVAVLDLFGIVDVGYFGASEDPKETAAKVLAPLMLVVSGFMLWTAWEDRFYD